MEAANGLPSAEELMELVNKQDSVIECLQEKLDISNEQVRLFREAEEKRRHSENESSEIVAAAEQRISSALAALQSLKTQNEKLENELEKLSKITEQEKPVPSVIQLRNKVKELEFDLVREQRAAADLRNEVAFQKRRVDQLQSELDACHKKSASVASSLSSKLDESVKELTELKIKYQSVLNERDHIASELGGKVEVMTQRSAHLQAHCERISSKLLKLRRECKVSECRIAALVEENAMLRGTASRRPSEEEGEQVQQLLKDQSHLIDALREESKLLLNQLESERKEYRTETKLFKRERRELEERLQKMLSS
ncbi:hypothetical protein V3C99_013798 [Haemonchus contortus]|uniref:Uncharacterized protein n=1 Tax=Haemonchus contortus TaxID=6289 RepID=A0A7I5EBZ8_HAECO|nr:golgin subfamily A member 1 [Haemonchus contortus]